MRQMLLSLLSKEKRHAVEPYITRAELNDDAVIIEDPWNGTKEVTIQQAGSLLAHAVTVRLCQEVIPLKEQSIVPFAWLCVAQDGFGDLSLEEMVDATMSSLQETWPSRPPRRPRAHVLRSIRRTHPPALVKISGEALPDAHEVVPAYLAQMERQDMISSYAESSRLRMMIRDPEIFSIDYTRDADAAIANLAQLVVHEVAGGSLQPQAIILCDGENLPKPEEHLASILTALTAMSPAAERSPALKPHRVDAFPVVVEKP